MLSKLNLSLLKNKNLSVKLVARCYSKEMSTLSLPVVELESFIDGNTGDMKQCQALVDGLKNYGCLAIRDPRVKKEQNDKFLDLMENYFENRSKLYYSGKKVDDFRPEYGYQVGSMPENTEKPRKHKKLIAKYTEDNLPTTPQPPPYDRKWRFFWRIGEIETTDEKLLPPQVIPAGFETWEKDCNEWGNLMKDSVESVSEMLALGFDLKRDTFTSLMNGAPQLLAPTGSDLDKYDQPDEILAGFHYDLNYITIHGRARYPGLSVWLRDGTKMKVEVPEGCLLIQGGKQLEWMTGGFIESGHYEVVATEEAIKQAKIQKSKGESYWKVSSTLLSQLNYNTVLEPLPKFRTQKNKLKYPPTVVYNYIEDELKDIDMLQVSHDYYS